MKALAKLANIVELIDLELTKNHVFGYGILRRKNLLNLVNNHEGNISELEVLLTFNQVLLGVNSLHSQNPQIIHKDLKIEKILRNEKL